MTWVINQVSFFEVSSLPTASREPPPSFQVTQHRYLFYFCREDCIPQYHKSSHSLYSNDLTACASKNIPFMIMRVCL